MAIVSALTNTFKAELLQGGHNFKASGGNTFKLALFVNATLGYNYYNLFSSNRC